MGFEPTEGLPPHTLSRSAAPRSSWVGTVRELASRGRAVRSEPRRTPANETGTETRAGRRTTQSHRTRSGARQIRTQCLTRSPTDLPGPWRGTSPCPGSFPPARRPRMPNATGGAGHARGVQAGSDGVPHVVLGVEAPDFLQLDIRVLGLGDDTARNPPVSTGQTRGQVRPGPGRGCTPGVATRTRRRQRRSLGIASHWPFDRAHMFAARYARRQLKMHGLASTGAARVPGPLRGYVPASAFRVSNSSAALPGAW